MFNKAVQMIKDSLIQIESSMENQLILNPVENIPKSEFLLPAISRLHGLYNTDKMRTDNEKAETKIQFSGRDQIAQDIQVVYDMWKKILKAQCISMRLFSGLHAHAVIFMALSNIGDKIVLLPEIAGGHMATKAILQRLGLEIYELPIDLKKQRVDITESRALIERVHPKIIFVDRSEGLVYEDFSWLKPYNSIYKIFDASQYLTNIIAEDYINPFDMGFDAIISTLHKNFPGPQRALFCAKVKDMYWDSYNNKIGVYVSNMHPYAIYSAGLMLEDMQEWRTLSSRMLRNTMLLDSDLINRGLSVIKRDTKQKHTHHIWISCADKHTAYRCYSNLERLGVLANYRLLPYNIGYGIRLGLSSATYSGLCPNDIPELGKLISDVIHFGFSDSLQQDALSFISKLKKNQYFARE